MFKRHFAFLLALTLVMSLITGTVASGAQSPSTLTETFTWDAYQLAVNYPGDWVAVDNGTAISIRPADRDVSDGYGPELVLFSAADANPADLEATINTFAANSGATPDQFVHDQIAGHARVSASLNWADPAARGAMQLIVLDDQSVIGAAYVVRTNDALAYTLPLLEIMQSIVFDAADGLPSLQVSESSVSITSVRLSESVTWDETGLILNLPEGWTSRVDMVDGSATIIATPQDAGGINQYNIIQATTVDRFEIFDLTAVAELTVVDYDQTSEIVETTVAGYPAVTYEFRDIDQGDTLYMRALMIDIPERDVIGLVIFATDETTWDAFRPVVSAVASSIQSVNGERSALGSGITLLANAVDVPFAPVPADALQQDEVTYTWEEAGATFTIPAGWTTQSGDGQDFDVALISPEVIQTGQGSFVKLRLLSMLGTSLDEFATAIQPVADQVGADEVTNPYELAGMEGVGIDYTDEENTGYVFHFVLLPYGDRGDAIYIQSTASPESDEAVVAMLNSMVLDIPTPDYAAVDAAWQTSLAETGTLTYGDADAPMKMIEFLSFTCSHCVNYSRSMERLIALDAETGRVQFTVAALAGDEYATNATHATYCATEQGKGFSVAEALFQSYVDLGYSEAYSRDGMNDLLSQFDLDMDEVNACIDEQRYMDNIILTSVAFTDMGLTGTPTVTFGVDGADPTPVVFPDGQVWSGAIPLHWVRDIIDAYIEDGITPNEFVLQ